MQLCTTEGGNELCIANTHVCMHVLPQTSSGRILVHFGLHTCISRFLHSLNLTCVRIATGRRDYWHSYHSQDEAALWRSEMRAMCAHACVPCVHAHVRTGGPDPASPIMQHLVPESNAVL